MAKDSCLARVATGVAVGGAVGGAVGAVYGTYEAFSIFSAKSKCMKMGEKTGAMYFMGEGDKLYGSNFQIWKICMKIPGALKIRHVGQTTLGSAAIFGLFLGAGSLIHCARSY